MPLMSPLPKTIPDVFRLSGPVLPAKTHTSDAIALLLDDVIHVRYRFTRPDGSTFADSHAALPLVPLETGISQSPLLCCGFNDALTTMHEAECATFRFTGNAVVSSGTGLLRSFVLDPKYLDGEIEVLAITRRRGETFQERFERAKDAKVRGTKAYEQQNPTRALAIFGSVVRTLVAVHGGLSTTAERSSCVALRGIVHANAAQCCLTLRKPETAAKELAQFFSISREHSDLVTPVLLRKAHYRLCSAYYQMNDRDGFLEALEGARKFLTEPMHEFTQLAEAFDAAPVGFFGGLRGRLLDPPIVRVSSSPVMELNPNAEPLDSSKCPDSAFSVVSESLDVAASTNSDPDDKYNDADGSEWESISVPIEAVVQDSSGEDDFPARADGSAEVPDNGDDNVQEEAPTNAEENTHVAVPRFDKKQVCNKDEQSLANQIDAQQAETEVSKPAVTLDEALAQINIENVHRKMLVSFLPRTAYKAEALQNYLCVNCGEITRWETQLGEEAFELFWRVTFALVSMRCVMVTGLDEADIANERKVGMALESTGAKFSVAPLADVTPALCAEDVALLLPSATTVALGRLLKIQTLVKLHAALAQMYPRTNTFLLTGVVNFCASGHPSLRAIYDQYETPEARRAAGEAIVQLLCEKGLAVVYRSNGVNARARIWIGPVGTVDALPTAE